MRTRGITGLRLFIGIFVAVIFVILLIVLLTAISHGNDGSWRVAAFGGHLFALLFELVVAFVCLRRPRPRG